MTIDLVKAERSLRMRGTASHEHVHVKIVSHGDGYGVETTVSGDRRYPVEEPVPMEEAIRLALSQLVEPRAKYEYVPEKKDEKRSPSRSQLPYVALGDLIDSYRVDGLDRQSAWGTYIKDSILMPRLRTETVDAKEFFRAYSSRR
jgi:hypothetical protein